MNRKQFLLILEQVLNTTIKNNNYSFDFKQNTNTNTLQCSFDTIDKNDKLATVNITINGSQIKKIQIEGSDKIQHLNQKQFLAKYNTEYNQFKQAFKKYKDQQFNKKYIDDKNKDNNRYNNTKIPSINIFNNIINNINQKQNINKIDIDNVKFFYKQKEDQIQNLYEVTFEINKDSQILNCIGLFKYQPQNSIFIKFKIKNSANNIKNLTLSQFKESYKEYYQKLSKSLQVFQKIQEKRTNLN